ncbi:hypothetical protein [Arcicella rosea]|uniref:Uncharacterized protein n=1 Tax=Arcicella rosea TaxID=502909 RepID=A0A841EI89_9BACT|nr:hypothetical protein [Arcicella rosea]MBB6003917.1 hypothetical protein [Arcicella rosea]
MPTDRRVGKQQKENTLGIYRMMIRTRVVEIKQVLVESRLLYKKYVD